MISDLPRDILSCIIEYVNPETLLELSLVDKYFNMLTNDEYLWKKRCFNYFNITQDIAYRQSGWKNLYFALRNPSVYTWGENFDQRLGLSSFEEETQMYLPASRYLIAMISYVACL